MDTTIILDSGLDITLVSAKLLQSLDDPPKPRKGQRISLLQVTGNSFINNFVSLPILVHTDSGPVSVDVEAYVVKNMNTPFLLGNDFVDQYGLSLVREEEGSFVNLGNSGRQIRVVDSVTSGLLDENGHAFSIRQVRTFSTMSEKRR